MFRGDIDGHILSVVADDESIGTGIMIITSYWHDDEGGST